MSTIPQLFEKWFWFGWHSHQVKPFRCLINSFIFSIRRRKTLYGLFLFPQSLEITWNSLQTNWAGSRLWRNISNVTQCCRNKLLFNVVWTVMMIRVINQQQRRSYWWSRPSWVVGPWNKGHVPLTSRPLPLRTPTRVWSPSFQEVLSFN